MAKPGTNEVYALINNNLVVNCIEILNPVTAAELNPYTLKYQYVVDITNALPQPGIGWGYDGTNFIPPQAPPQVVVPVSKITTPQSFPYTVQPVDAIVNVGIAGSNVLLPDATQFDLSVRRIVDTSGAAKSSPIVLTPSVPGQLINGQPSYSLNLNNGSVGVFSNGINWQTA